MPAFLIYLESGCFRRISNHDTFFVIDFDRACVLNAMLVDYKPLVFTRLQSKVAFTTRADFSQIEFLVAW